MSQAATFNLPPNSPITAEILGDILTASKLLVRIMRERLAQTREPKMRPCHVLRPQLSQYQHDDGRWYWLAQYGELCVAGETPEQAFARFDEKWIGE